MTAVFPHKNNTSMNKSNTLYWKTATDPAERIEVRLVLNSYIDNDNLYVGLESRSKENPECWESYTDITVNLNSLPPFHAYVELEESLIEGVRNLDAAANELLDGICLFCSTQELRYLTDAELIETIYAQ